MFAETGLLIGFFLPGDSLLFTAGLLAATATSNPLHLSLGAVYAAAAAGAILGAEAGYVIGRTAGPRLLDRADRPPTPTRRVQIARGARALRTAEGDRALPASSPWSEPS